MDFVKFILLFIVAGFFEIGGGYLIWLYLRECRGIGFAIIGAIILVLYGIVPTLQPLILEGCTLLTGVFSYFFRSYGGGV